MSDSSSTASASGGSEDRRSSRPRQYLTALDQFALALKKTRRSRKLSLRRLAEILDIDHNLLHRAEQGTNVPTTAVMKRIDAALDANGALVILAHVARAEPYSALPTKPAYLVGREDVLDRLTELLVPGPGRDTARRTVVITGEPGVGKTAVVLQWANETRDAFHTVLYADLRGFSGSPPAQPDEILGHLLKGLGVNTDQLPPRAKQRLAHFRGHLDRLGREGKRVLVVLDNARDSRQVKPVLPGTPNATVLTTSRQRLSGLTIEAGAVHLRVRPLDEDAAARLAAHYTDGDCTDITSKQVKRLARVCDYLPLALTIACQRISADRGKTLDEHLNELETACLDLLDADPGQEAATGVRAAFSWSYASLPERHAELFKALGVHPGAQFSVGAAAALIGAPLDDTTDLLEYLVQAHLLEQRGHRSYRLHDLLHDYAAEKTYMPAWEDERNQAIARLAQWYVHAANSAAGTITPTRDHHVRLDPPIDGVPVETFSDYSQALGWCNAEMASITPMAQLALDNGLLFEAWRLPVELIDYHVVRRPWRTWVSSIEVALEAARRAEEPTWIAQAADNLAEAYRRQGKLDQAEELDKLALKALEPVGDHPRRGWALTGLGNTAHARGQYELAAKYTEQGLIAQIALGHRIGELHTRIHLGRAYRELGRREDAMREGLIPVDEFNADGDRHGEATALIALSRTCQRFGEYEEALEYCERVRVLANSLADYWAEAEAVALKGELLNSLGDRNRGLQHMTEALGIIEDLDEFKAQRLRDKIAELRCA
ncbi:tetratricopeptide repeat protein [Amycolatopsis sp. WAC 01375]|uniref:ATP-binding protein n=1 Tax=Amycolatopsis sp. WAC 01375 TaxID=2203194 RepID=UPI001315AAF3|nr:tetratricopeptide repeat protein [Amycolatopsis sp. WAC 01375]